MANSNSNPNNDGTLIGRLQSDPKVLNNSNGSKTVLATIVTEENFLRRDQNKRLVDFVPVKDIVPAEVEGAGVWTNIGKGDLVAMKTYIDCKPYKKDGQTVYPAPTIRVGSLPQFLEPKSVTEARATRNAAEAARDQIQNSADQAPAEPADQAQAAQIADLQAQIQALQAQGGAPAQPMTDASETPFGN